jgi:RNA recognition motif-containing protein
LRKLFEEYGHIVSVFVKSDPVRKAPFGFVCFDSNESAKKALRAYGFDSKRDPLKTGRPVYVGWA